MSEVTRQTKVYHEVYFSTGIVETYPTLSGMEMENPLVQKYTGEFHLREYFLL